jgi:hypothetical protein
MASAIGANLPVTESVAQRPDGDDIGRRATYHLLRFEADGNHSPALSLDRDHRWLVDDYAFAPHTHQSVGSAKIYTYVK